MAHGGYAMKDVAVTSGNATTFVVSTTMIVLEEKFGVTASALLSAFRKERGEAKRR